MILLQITQPENVSKLFNSHDFILQFGTRFLINLISVFILIRFIYLKINKHSELFFTFFISNIIIFLMCFFLNKVNISMGAAFGMFAIFGMLRYKTEDLSIKDMSYLFLVIALGLMSAIVKIEDSSYLYEFIFITITNAVILLITYLLESGFLIKRESVKFINYENMELIKPENNIKLLEDLELRTGLKINRIIIGKLDFFKSMAQIKIYYDEN